MSSTQSAALKHWARIIKQWPVDKVRPEAVSFQRLMQQRIQRSTEPSSVINQGKKNTAEVVQPRAWNESNELRQAYALDSLLENRFAKEYPMPQSLRHPASNPTHYDDVAREMEEAPTRSWFSGVMQRLRGSLRLR